MLSKYPKATSVSWALDENEQKMPLEHCLLPKSGVPAEGQILVPRGASRGPNPGSQHRSYVENDLTKQKFDIHVYCMSFYCMSLLIMRDLLREQIVTKT